VRPLAPGPEAIAAQRLNYPAQPMELVLVASDAEVVFDMVDSALGSASVDVEWVRQGRGVRQAVIDLEPDLVVIDLQIGSMGGVAATLDLRNEESGERLYRQQVLLLLDRAADVYIAQQSGADGWLIKPLDAARLQQAAGAVAGGGTWFEGSTSTAIA